MALADLVDWLDDFTGPSIVWYVKRLSGNDTLANGSHQAGPYIPRAFLFEVFPAINRTDIKNPDFRFDVYIDSHADHRVARVIYYNNKFHENPKGGRNEARITGFRGASSALLDPESTGALTVFAFTLDGTGAATECHVWVCRHETEEDLVEDRIGPVEPGKWTIWSPGRMTQPSLFQPQLQPRASCWLDPDEIPSSWLTRFPTGAEIIRKAVELRAAIASSRFSAASSRRSNCPESRPASRPSTILSRVRKPSYSGENPVRAIRLSCMPARSSLRNGCARTSISRMVPSPNRDGALTSCFLPRRPIAILTFLRHSCGCWR